MAVKASVVLIRFGWKIFDLQANYIKCDIKSRKSIEYIKIIKHCTHWIQG